MNSQDYFIFIAIAYIASPGPAVFLSINYSAIYGFKRTFVTLLGNTTGLGILAFISAVGVGTLIVNSPLVATIIKIIGAIVLLYIGIKMIVSSRLTEYIKIDKKNKTDKSFYNSYKEGLILALSNPKPIIFFTSIYPQFIIINGNENQQFFILGFSFMILSLLCLSLYAIISKYTLGKFLNDKRAKSFNFVSGITFIILAILLLSTNY
ncbi:LysE family translocator [Arcobacteraceae bacterium]|nr:LysE family translocator [Arcobacteraceae bacterium]